MNGSTLVLFFSLLSNTGAFLLRMHRRSNEFARCLCYSSNLELNSNDARSRPEVARDVSRRGFLTSSIAVSQVLGLTLPASAVESNSKLDDLISTQAESAQLETGLLESRVMENFLYAPTYGMEGTDVYYPK